MKVFENELLTMSYEKSDNLYVEKWQPTTKDMTEEQWKETRLKLMDVFVQYNADKILALSENFYFVITPELQGWLAENITKKVGHRVKKIAITVPAEIFSEVSVQQLMDEKETGELHTKYFGDEEEARAWLTEE